MGPELNIPPFIKIAYVGVPGRDLDYVVTNEATGRHFGADKRTVEMIEALRQSGSLAYAIRSVGLKEDQSKTLIEKLMNAGVLVQRGHTREFKTAKAPIESKAISFRFDLINAGNVAAKFEWLGRIAYSRIGFLLWSVAIVAMVYFLATNIDKARYAIQQVPNASFEQILYFIILFLGLKVVHEIGHALAYRVMCLRERLEPGPIRMGICIFAMTPFPFTDVTGAWRIRSKWRRATIGAGGVYFELGATALLTIFWGLTSTETLQVTIFQVAIFSAASTLLFNFNPAVKLDGYYVLSDLLGQYNMLGRASMAARQWFARRLGASIKAPEANYLAYWLLAYLYRWSIFIGIFWLAYQFDQRLAAPLLIIVILMLIARPLIASFSFAKQNGIRPLNSSLAGLFALFVIGLSLIPFPDRLLLEGRVVQYRSEFIYAVEPAQLKIEDQEITLINNDLNYQRADVKLRQSILENTARAVSGTPAEQARILAEQESLEELEASYQRRLNLLRFNSGGSAKWTPILAEIYEGAWITPRTDAPLGAFSEISNWRVLVWLEEGRVEQDLLERQNFNLEIRLVQDPSCQFTAVVEQSLREMVSFQKSFNLVGFPLGDLPLCLSETDHGGAVVARVETIEKSLIARGKRWILRLLQNRLPGQEQQI